MEARAVKRAAVTLAAAAQGTGSRLGSGARLYRPPRHHGARPSGGPDSAQTAAVHAAGRQARSNRAPRLSGRGASFIGRAQVPFASTALRPSGPRLRLALVFE